MKYSRPNLQQVLFIATLIISFFISSCDSQSSNSELMTKVNAVQKQMMIQGNINDEEKQAFVSLSKMINENKSYNPNISNDSKSELIAKVVAVQKQMNNQDSISVTEKQAISSLISLVSFGDGADESVHKAIPFKDVENVPTYTGCENLSKEETRKCFTESIDRFFNTNYNPKIAQDLGITTKQSVDAFFTVDENGKVTNIKVREANVAIQAEITRVIRKIPSMQPATQNGKNVSVLYSFSVPYGGN